MPGRRTEDEYSDHWDRGRDRERKKVNYDHPDAFETELLLKQLEELKAGRSIHCPVYDYSQHNRSDQVVLVEPRRVILLEGILVLADEKLRELLDIKA